MILVVEGMGSGNDSLSQRESAVIGRNKAMGKHPQTLALQQQLDEGEQRGVLEYATRQGNRFDLLLPGESTGHAGDGDCEPFVKAFTDDCSLLPLLQVLQ